MRISNSFSEGEVQILEFILQSILRGGTPATVTRHKDFPSLYRKVLTMKKRLGDRVPDKDGVNPAAPKASGSTES